MFLLVPAHPDCPGQIPQSRKTVVLCVCNYFRLLGYILQCCIFVCIISLHAVPTPLLISHLSNYFTITHMHTLLVHFEHHSSHHSHPHNDCAAIMQSSNGHINGHTCFINVQKCNNMLFFQLCTFLRLVYVKSAVAFRFS